MAEAKMCDRCGVFYKEEHVVIGFMHNKLEIERLGFIKADFYDLCPECMKDLKEWLEKGKGND